MRVLFRKLEALGSLTSYSHRRRFHTPAEVAAFDERGLWEFDMERLMGNDWTPDELREQGARYAATGRAARERLTFPALTDADIQHVRSARAGVFARWAAVGPGQTLELAFTRRGSCAVHR